MRFSFPALLSAFALLAAAAPLPASRDDLSTIVARRETTSFSLEARDDPPHPMHVRFGFAVAHARNGVPVQPPSEPTLDPRFFDDDFDLEAREPSPTQPRQGLAVAHARIGIAQPPAAFDERFFDDDFDLEAREPDLRYRVGIVIP